MIGIYDSGVGGLHILSALQKHLGEDFGFCYLADTRALPLGQKTPTQIRSRVEDACEWFFRNDCKLVILACNTASVVSIRHIQMNWLGSRYPTHNVLGINIPLLEYMQTHHSHLHDAAGIVLSTIATYATRFYEMELRARGFSNIHGIGSSRLPQAIEMHDEGLIAQELQRIGEQFSKMSGGKPAYIVHACTHFPLINAYFAEYFPRAKLIDHADWTGRQLAKYLHAHPSYRPVVGKTKLYTTGTSENVQRVWEALFDRRRPVVAQAQIGV